MEACGSTENQNGYQMTKASCATLSLLPSFSHSNFPSHVIFCLFPSVSPIHSNSLTLSLSFSLELSVSVVQQGQRNLYRTKGLGRWQELWKRMDPDLVTTFWSETAALTRAGRLSTGYSMCYPIQRVNKANVSVGTRKTATHLAIVSCVATWRNTAVWNECLQEQQSRRDMIS